MGPDARHLGPFLLALVLAAACAGPSGDVEPLLVGDAARFAEEVQPVITERCATGGCHGRPDRPLCLYAPGQHRADPARLHLDEPLTSEEIGRNARRLASFAHGTGADGSLTLQKPLATGAGGCWHGGGDVFVDRSDPDYRAVRAWLATREAPDGGTR